MLSNTSDIIQKQACAFELEIDAVEQKLQGYRKNLKRIINGEKMTSGEIQSYFKEIK